MSDLKNTSSEYNNNNSYKIHKIIYKEGITYKEALIEYIHKTPDGLVIEIQLDKKEKQ